MCGITGSWHPTPLPKSTLIERLTAMSGCLRHRGPDSDGVWVEPAVGLGLAQRRLAIVDLSPAGHQPMLSASGRFVLVFNGEIYNHLSLRAELAKAGLAPVWRGHSDTETLLAAVEAWGLTATLQRCVGMFALALWDRRERTLQLARDRFGEKPLYYGWAADAFVFASELKAIRALPGFANPLDQGALLQYLRFVSVPAPRSIYQSLFKLEPGCLLTLNGQPPALMREPPRPPLQQDGFRLERWWSAAEAVQRGLTAPFTGEREALDLLESTLSEAVRLQLLADVPLGAFLSGGIDSSLVAALMQQHSRQPVKTFTIGFEQAEYDESPFAAAVAQQLGTEHTTRVISATEALALIPHLPTIYDEPFADSSQIATHLVAQTARRAVTVALSGDGGDELFGGYNRYFWGPRIWRRLTWLPYPARRTLAQVLLRVPTSGWDVLLTPNKFMQPHGTPVRQFGDKLHKLAERLQMVQDIDGLYRSLVSEWSEPQLLLQGHGTHEPASLLDDPLPDGLREAPLRMMYRDSQTYLPDDILCKVDRAAMAVSLETRVPLLDHRVFELAWRLPLSMKIRDNRGKWALRQLLARHLPAQLIDRPKAGFALPIGEWLRGPLRDWAEDLLDEQQLRGDGLLNPQPIRRAWAEHLSGRRDWTPRLWSVLMLQAWRRNGS